MAKRGRQRGSKKKRKWKTKRKYKITTINHCAPAQPWLQLQLTFSICQLPASYANLPRPSYILSLSLFVSLLRERGSSNPSTM